MVNFVYFHIVFSSKLICPLLNLTNNYILFGFVFPVWLLIPAGFVVSFLITYISIPPIIKISEFRNLYDIPNERASHNNKVPLLGGLSLFSGFTMSAIVFSLPVGSSDIRFLLGGLIILLFLGLKDDIMMLDPWKKLIGQVLAASIIVILGDVRVTSFHMVFGIGSLGYIPSVLFTVFLFLLLINAFNLIDGVDGLSSGAGIIASFVFGAWFILTGHFNDGILCFSLAGSLISYFVFNVFGRTNKIFMGDTGAMITGVIIAFFTTRFLDLEESVGPAFRFLSAPAIAFGILFLPLFDTLRIIIIRLFNGKSPFQADRQHIHHLVLKFGFTHLQVTLILLSFNMLILSIMFFLQPLGGFLDVLIALVFSFVLSSGLGYLLKKRELLEIS